MKHFIFANDRPVFVIRIKMIHFKGPRGVRDEDRGFRDGPLENLWGARAKYKKKIRAREN